MNRSRVWLGSVVASVLAVGFVAWFPGYRVERAFAAARAEGVPLEMADLRRLFPKTPAAENAAGPIARAFAQGLAFEARNGSLDVATSNVALWRATEGDRAKLRAAFTKHPELLTGWHDASRRPKLDYDRDWEKGSRGTWNEYDDAEWGIRRLVAAAKVGIEPEKNLRAAARIVALMRSQPLTYDVLVGNTWGGQILRAAKPLGLAKGVDEELGPPVDARRSILPEPSRAILIVRSFDAYVPERGARLWLRRLSFWRTSALLRDVQAWRGLWRDLPKDGTDYGRVAAALDRWMPELQATMLISAGPGYTIDPRSAGETVRAFADFEAERAAARR